MGIRRAEVSDGGVVGVTVTCPSCDGTGELHSEYPFPTSLIDGALDRIAAARKWMRRADETRTDGRMGVMEDREMAALVLMTVYERGYLGSMPDAPPSEPEGMDLFTGLWEMSREDLVVHLHSHHGYTGIGHPEYTKDALRYIHDDHERFSVPEVPHAHEADPNEGVPEFPSALDMHIFVLRDHMVSLHDTTGTGVSHFRRMEAKRLLTLHQIRHANDKMLEPHTHAISEEFGEFEPSPDVIDPTERTSDGVEYP